MATFFTEKLPVHGSAGVPEFLGIPELENENPDYSGAQKCGFLGTDLKKTPIFLPFFTSNNRVDLIVS